ncbi:MAG: TonB family protein [Gammaproteobacteria bacterium]|nr:TonB family protein [Gammaproteobacteria bacterium]MBU1645173.1 TonB family protein [Gammaproteobacteria bacterium]MBU1973410.1 TonB family protein [Gammaproteobacteria bacterium]
MVKLSLSNLSFGDFVAAHSLALGITVSVLLHGTTLSVNFVFPGTPATKERALDVILVNSKSTTRPTNVQAKAQANLDGGGNTDEDRRATTPLPVSKQTKEGDSLVDAKRRVAQLEAQQREMMTQLKSPKATAAAAKHNDPIPPAPLTPPNVSGLDLASSAMAVARLEGQIARNIEEYNKRPRKKFIGARTEEYRFAQYVEDWRQKVERIGNLNYPEAARGKMYGSLVLTVIIKADGTLERVDINRPSAHKVLDDTARRIVQMASPYAPFPSNIARDTDILEITRTWTFTSADQLRSD